MAADEDRRHRLFRKLEQVLGSEEAATLMEHLHPKRWDELATKADLAGLAAKADLAGLAAKADLAGLAAKADLAGLAAKADLAGLAAKADLAGLATKADLESFEGRLGAQWERTADRFDAQQQWAAERFGHLETHLEAAKHEVLGTVRGEMNRLVTSQTRTIVFALLATLTANTGLVLTAVRLG